MGNNFKNNNNKKLGVHSLFSTALTLGKKVLQNSSKEAHYNFKWTEEEFNQRGKDSTFRKKRTS